VDYYILELSSYQLDLVTAMPLEVAGLLNLSPDHLDRYSSAEAYFQSKLSIFDNARTAVISEQLLEQGYTSNCGRVLIFGESTPTDNSHYGLTHNAQGSWLMKGADVLMDCADLQVLGRHNQLNALAALAMGDAMGLDLAQMVETLRDFKGLPHRCELIFEKDRVKWINDSKATNVAATLSAIDALQSQGRLILILGGEAKAADFSALQLALSGKVKKVLLLGEAQDAIAASLAEAVDWEKQVDYESAVARAVELADAGDIVMLSPACSSLDMFSSYIERGEFFTRLVQKVLA
jgi:UDP-N-acetylmuramoylalanine--D-glutamate ligase